MRELRLDEGRYKKYFRMLPHQMDDLVSTIGSALQKMNTHFRESIEPAQRVAIALRYSRHFLMESSHKFHNQRMKVTSKKINIQFIQTSIQSQI